MGVLDWFRGGKGRAYRQVDEWHRAWSDAAAAPEASRIVELERRLAALGRPEEDVEIEREMLAGLSELVDLRQASSNGTLPTIETGHRVVGTDICHFSVPSSRPDHPAQPSGRLIPHQPSRHLCRGRAGTDGTVARGDTSHGDGPRHHPGQGGSRDAVPLSLQQLRRSAPRHVHRASPLRRPACEASVIISFMRSTTTTRPATSLVTLGIDRLLEQGALV